MPKWCTDSACRAGTAEGRRAKKRKGRGKGKAPLRLRPKIRSRPILACSSSGRWLSAAAPISIVHAPIARADPRWAVTRFDSVRATGAGLDVTHLTPIRATTRKCPLYSIRRIRATTMRCNLSVSPHKVLARARSPFDARPSAAVAAVNVDDSAMDAAPLWTTSWPARQLFCLGET